MNDGVMIGSLIALLIPVILMTIFIPYWTRKTESFGVSIPADVFNEPILQALRKRYMMQMIFISIIYIFTLLVIFLTIPMSDQTTAIVYTISIFLYLLISFFVYLVFHRQMKQIKKDEGWFRQRKQQTYIHTNFRNQKLTVSHALFVIPFVITIIMIAWTLTNYDLFPNKIPMNYSLTGEVTNWANKSIGTVLFLPLTQFGLAVIFLGINIVIERAKQQISASDPETSLQRNIIFRRRWSGFLFIASIGLIILFTVAQLSLIYSIHPTVLMIVFLVVIISVISGSVLLSITTGQGGSRIKLPTKIDAAVIDYDDDQYWKLGLFYFNKNDPTVFIEKRFGVGWSVNWARPLAWGFLIGILVISIGLPILLTR